MPNLTTTKWVHAFKAGKHTSSNGQEGSYTENDLDELVDAVNKSVKAGDHRVPAVLGHPKHDDPAYGWVEKAKRIGGDFFVKFKNIASDLATAVDDKKYQSISIRLYPREHPNNPTPGKLNLGHVGFFGAVQPAVKGMKPVELGEFPDDLLSFEFSENQLNFSEKYFSYYIFSDIAGVFRNFREYLIEENGIAVADRIVPGYAIDSLQRTSGMEGFCIPEEKEDDDDSEKALSHKESEMDLEEAKKVLESQGYTISSQQNDIRTRLFSAIAEFQEKANLSDSDICEALGIEEKDFMSIAGKKPTEKDMEEAAKLLGMSSSKLQKMIAAKKETSDPPQKDMSDKEFATKQNLSDLMAEVAALQKDLNQMNKETV